MLIYNGTNKDVFECITYICDSCTVYDAMSDITESLCLLLLMILMWLIRVYPDCER